MTDALVPGVRAHGDAVTVTVHVVPNARKTECVGLHGDAIKVKLAAPPVDGRANDTLQLWLAEVLGVARSEVRLIQGASNRRKVLAVSLSPERANGRIRTLLESA